MDLLGRLFSFLFLVQLRTIVKEQIQEPSLVNV